MRRRDFIKTSAAAVAAGLLAGGCESPVVAPMSGAGPDAGAADLADAAMGSGDRLFQPGDATPECLETEDNIEGPFYRPGAPMRSLLVEEGMAGTRLSLVGRVYGVGCATPLSGALLDLWQADASGVYDNVGFRLRGRVVTDDYGYYGFGTIVPGRYLNGPDDYRPAHLHVKVSAEGYLPLTTQIYFAGDPFLASDPFVKASLITPLADERGGAKGATFHFVLSAAQ